MPPKSRKTSTLFQHLLPGLPLSKKFGRADKGKAHAALEERRAHDAYADNDIQAEQRCEEHVADAKAGCTLLLQLKSPKVWGHRRRVVANGGTLQKPHIPDNPFPVILRGPPPPALIQKHPNGLYFLARSIQPRSPASGAPHRITNLLEATASMRSIFLLYFCMIVYEKLY